MTAALAEARFPDLRGFDKENRELVYAMIDSGWTGRITSKNHWLGRSPDGKATVTVPSKNGNNRGLKNATAQFMKWVRDNATPEERDLYAAADGATDPVVREVIIETLSSKQAHRMVAESIKEPTLVEQRPWLARKQPGRNGGVMYESEAVVERLWSDGTTDYACSTGCGYVAESARSVATHYGKAHTAKGETPPASQDGPHHVAPDYTEPLTSRYTPTDRMVATLMGVLNDILNETADMRETAIRLLTWIHERPDLEPREERERQPLTDTDILNRIRVLVGQPDLSNQIDALKAANDELAAEVTRLKEERAALRDLLSEGE